ncbi:hypothetical protein H696_03777 [Fonticula alba]|uniref:Uncharacterized protein n=1 Tax=Fonticula alba TaxID=691883 RepID=A0A058Z4Z7_FONAL|nr:hypothetical protein H696_03777 [Fonticula alba]KCV69345.1 hypothetical protein H696_03777 [Fonticula alba]|eukprot:XP_009495910.1 hypothetical protein H696_03777 [Fonticula alba]
MARSEAGAPTVSFFQQFRALFLKNASLFLSRKSTVVVQLVIPILLLSLIGGLTILIDRALDEANQTGYVERYQPFDASNPFVLTELERPSWRSMFNSPPFFHVSFNSDDAIGNELGFLTFLGERFGVLGTIEQEVQPEIGMVPETHYPFFVEHANHTSVNSALFDVYALWKDLLNDSGLGPQPAPDDYWQITNQTIEWHAAREYEKLLPYGALLVDDLHLPVAVPGESLSPRDFHLNYTSMAATRYGGLRILGRDIRTSPRDPPPTALSAAPGASAPRAALIVRALTQALLPRMLSRAANPPVAGPQEGLSACAHAYQENDPLLPVSYLSTIFPETDRRINLQNIFHNAFRA